MFQTLKNAWHMPELRKKILYTLFILLIFRFGSCILFCSKQTSWQHSRIIKYKCVTRL